MFTELSVEEIVDSYAELSEKQKKRIIYAAKRGIEEFGITSFDHQYQYIADLVEKWNSPWSEKKAMRLDAPISDEPVDTFEQLIGKRDLKLEDLFEDVSHYQEKTVKKEDLFKDSLSEDDDGKNPLSTAEIFDILSKEIGENNVLLLKQLSGKKDDVLHIISKEELLSIVPKIQERMAGVGERYNRDGKIIIPQRPIKDIRFTEEGLEIKFGQRDWRKTDPLTFFKKHRDIYGGMSQNELKIFDSGLHDALKKNGQFQEIFPEIKSPRKFGNPLVYFRNHLDIYGKMSRGQLQVFDSGLYHALRTNKQLDDATPDETTYKKKLYESQAQDIELTLSSDEEGKILEAYSLGMTVDEAVAYTCKEGAVITKYLKSVGKEPKYGTQSARRIPLTPELILAVKEALMLSRDPSYGAQYVEKKAGVRYCDEFIAKLWSGLGWKPKNRRVNEEALKRIDETGKMGVSAAQAAKYAGVSQSSVLKRWHEAEWWDGEKPVAPDEMTASEVATHFGLGICETYKKASEGIIPGWRSGREWRFKRSEIEKLQLIKIVGDRSGKIAMSDEQNKEIDFSETMTAYEVAQYLKTSTDWVCILAKKGVIPAVRSGRTWRFKKTDVFNAAISTGWEKIL